ncbi:MAG: hypothetical protein HWQ38_39255 [Nostoc sp. NMS7]|nr:hypothetical protein [Nostoc sp. NMS7]
MGYSALKRGDSVAVAVSAAVGTAVGLALMLYLSMGVVTAVDAAVGTAVGLAVFMAVFMAVDWVINLAEDSFTTVLILLTLGFGASVGTGIIASFLNPFILLALTGTSLPAFSMGRTEA